MSICVLSHQDEYDVRSGSVKDGWDHFLLEVRNRPRTRPTKCSTCRIRTVCSTCAAVSELENGNAETPVDFMCEVAHLRAVALGCEVPEHGDCEFCREGEQRQAMLEAAARIASHENNVAAWAAPQILLPVLNASAATSGCGGCGTH
jgi:radical SAM protein with 4Fe4S-binding SPASM domain